MKLVGALGRGQGQGDVPDLTSDDKTEDGAVAMAYGLFAGLLCDCGRLRES